MIGHDYERPKSVVTEFRSAHDRVGDQRGNGVLSKKHRPPCRAVQITIDPDEGLSGRDVAWWRILGRWKASVQTPSDEEPATFRIVVR